MNFSFFVYSIHCINMQLYAMKRYEQKEKFFFGVMHSTIIHRLVITNTGGRKEVLLVFISKAQRNSINRWHGT